MGYTKEQRYKPESKVVEIKNKYGYGSYASERIDNVCVTTFNSIWHLTDYLEKTPVNDVCKNNSNLSSQYVTSFDFSGTKTYAEAVELLKNGYTVGTERLKQALAAESKMDERMSRKVFNDMVGFQPIVANYLMGVPNAMVNVKMVPLKKKIVTINKCIDYNGGVTTEQITQYSIRTLKVIKALEAQGYAVNLNIVDGYNINDNEEIIKVRIKNANESLNLHKLSFPLTHPSMLRRIMFRYVELSDTLAGRCNSGRSGYIGRCVGDSTYLKILGEQKEIFLNRYMSEDDIEKAKTLATGKLNK